MERPLPSAGPINPGRFNIHRGDGVERRQEDHHVKPGEHPGGDQDQGWQGRRRVRQPGFGILPQADRPQDEVRHSPFVVVDPQPDNANHRIRDEERGKPYRAEEARQGNLGMEHQGEGQRQRHVDDGGNDTPNKRVSRGPPKHFIARQDLFEVLQSDKLVGQPQVLPEDVKAVKKGDQYRVDDEGQVEEEGGTQKHRDRAPGPSRLGRSNPFAGHASR